VLELMGGVTFAKDVIFGAIEKGKHVITANKALIAGFMDDLIALLAANPTVKFMYEAAVGGGIPIIHTMRSTFVSDSVTDIAGILNGTTNFMLSKMSKEGKDYADVLKEAQDLGFAEADPTADVEGLDVQAKLCILCKLAFGSTIPLADIPCTGITKITSDDFFYASKFMNNAEIKLLGIAMKDEAGVVSAFVSPAVVNSDNVIASVHGVTNIVDIKSTSLMKSSLVGPGAGRFPTANSVVQDLVLLGQNLVPKPFPPTKTVTVSPDYKSKFYVRMHIKDGLGIIRTVGELCEKNNIGINAVLQNVITDPNDVKFVVTTEPCKVSQVKSMCEQFDQLEYSLSPPLFLPIL
jgi:homoserine dehydrogenase